jgi:hypothetical protein
MLNIFKSCTSYISCTKLSNKKKEELKIKRIKILPEYKKLVHLRYLEKIKKSFNV